MRIAYDMDATLHMQRVSCSHTRQTCLATLVQPEPIFWDRGDSDRESGVVMVLDLTYTVRCSMLAHGWNLLCHDGLEVIQECSARGIKIHNAVIE